MRQSGGHQGLTKGTLGSKLFDALNITIMLLITFCILYPFINLLAISLNESVDASRGGIYFFPRKFSLDAYERLFYNDDLLKAFIISLLRVIVGSFTCVFATGLLAYIVSNRSFSGRKFMRIIFILPMFFNAGLIPFYLLLVKLGLINTFAVYWLPTLIDGFYMLIMASFIQDIPESLVEAARLDGCSELRIYFQIIVPTATPVFAAIFIFSSVYHWNSWFDVLTYNPSREWDTLQAYLRRILLEAEALKKVQNSQYAYKDIKSVSPLTIRAAMTILVTVPIVFVYPFFQKYLITGVTLGSVKG